jgi:hypothetical protein
MIDPLLKPAAKPNRRRRTVPRNQAIPPALAEVLGRLADSLKPQPQPQPAAVDLTGGGRFNLDLKTILVIVALVGSYYGQTGKIDAINARLDLQDKTRVEVQAAHSEADKARAELAAVQQKALADSISKLDKQLTMTALDVGDLKTAIALKTAAK